MTGAPARTLATVGHDLDDVRRFIALDHGLAVVSVSRPDGSIGSSLVNAGVLEHPTTGEPVVGLVVREASHKAAHLRRDPRCTLVWRSGWRWIGVSGPVEMAGPDDPLGTLDPGALPALLRAVFAGAGGVHEDWEEFDRVMAEEQRLAVLVRAVRIYGNPNP